jgi:hypothetical protein
MKQLIIVILVALNISTSAQQSIKGKWSFNNGVNATIDKSLVQRVLFITNNKASYSTKNNMLEITANYRYGHVTPIGRPRTSLENDLFLQIQNHFVIKHKVFPSVTIGFENSKHLRSLKQRVIAGAGPSIHLAAKPNNIATLSLYTLYEQSKFASFNYTVWRALPTLSGFAQYGKLLIVYNASYGVAINNSGNYRARLFVKPGYKIGKNITANLMYDMWTENITEGNQPKEISTLTFGLAYTKQ